jgi:hypothetical protein
MATFISLYEGAQDRGADKGEESVAVEECSCLMQSAILRAEALTA